jgi:hypothetical protein
MGVLIRLRSKTSCEPPTTAPPHVIAQQCRFHHSKESRGRSQILKTIHACVCLLLLQAGRAERECAFHLALKDMMDYLHTGGSQGVV